MILLLSFDGDRNTNRLIDWLHYFGQKFKRIHLNDEDFYQLSILFEKEDVVLKLKLHNGEIINFSDFPVIYNRGIVFNKPKYNNDTEIPSKLLKHYLQQEFECTTDFFYNSINEKSFGCFRTNLHYKINQLNVAQKNGLSIPNTLITNNTTDIIKHFENRKIITKAIQDNIALEYKGKYYLQTVQSITNKECPDNFFPSLFQENVDKTIEIRSFYLDGDFYSLSIETESKQVDLKDNYDNANYCRYKLPSEIELKLKKVMNDLKLCSGSIDLLLTNDNQFTFLEVNPNGQYDWVSQYGDYNLHKIIAEFLIKKLKNANKEK